MFQAMKNYRRSGGEIRSRCMSCLFKAVGNMALNASNMNRFMQANIETAYAEFLEEADQELDDSTIKACFKSLANLVIEKVREDDRDNIVELRTLLL